MGIISLVFAIIIIIVIMITQVENMKEEYRKQREAEEQLLKVEDDDHEVEGGEEGDRDVSWDLHSEFCPHKVSKILAFCTLAEYHVRM